MRLNWNHTRRLDPNSMEDLVLLSQAAVSCAGAARDEFLVDEIVHLLTATGRSNFPLGSAAPSNVLARLAIPNRIGIISFSKICGRDV